tara:strand:- start:4269 stop:4478 length:210 start_codon:yes stop_codon:yes gene_type:complete
MSNTLEKGAIPRLVQEVYFTSNSKGEVMINQKLTIQEFRKQLNELQNKEYDKIEDNAIDNFCDILTSHR